MKFTSIQMIVDYYTNLANNIYYKQLPYKPKQDKNETHTLFGIRLDEWEKECSEIHEKNKEQRDLSKELYKELVSEIFKFLKVDRKNEQISKAWDIAWDRNHSTGYNDVIDFFECLLDLIGIRTNK